MHFLLKFVLTFHIAVPLITPTLSEFISDPPFYSQKYASIRFARSIIIDDVGDLIVSTRMEESRIYLIYEEVDQANGSVTVVQDILLDAPKLLLNHGLAYNKGFLYVSNQTTVLRWAYSAGQRTPLDLTQGQVVIANIPEGYHSTRTIIFGPDDLFYLQVGSMGDVDISADLSRARICRYNLTEIPTGGIDYTMCEIFVYGLRSTVGLGFDSQGVLWGVENGINRPQRPDLGTNIWFGNPAEELNRFDQPPGAFYGFPFCFSSHVLENYPNNTQFVEPDFMDGGIYSDDWCQDPANNQPPILALAAHTAPLGIEFYKKPETCDKVEGAFPCEAIDDAFIPFHATEYLENATFHGNRVSWLPFDSETKKPTGEFITVIYEEDTSAGNCGSACFQPVNAVFDHKGHMFVSTDWAGEIYRVTYGTPPPIVTRTVLKY